MIAAIEKNKIEFGDFQTPLPLAMRVISLLIDEVSFESIIEPTCGLGNFLIACYKKGIPSCQLHGWEINPTYVEQANKQLAKLTSVANDYVANINFFQINWQTILAKYKKPILFVGNPPWVTNAKIGRLLGRNLPDKSNNFTSFNGFDAITGKSNFDISESMLIKMLEVISGTHSSMSFFIKISIARKLFQYSAKHKLKIGSFSIRKIDTKKEFKVSVDACLFIAKGSLQLPDSYICAIYDRLDSEESTNSMAIQSEKLIANMQNYKKLYFIDGICEFKWRSGVKHDCSKVMEFSYENGLLQNGLGEKVSITPDFLYPMYKSSDIAKQTKNLPRRYMLLTQRRMGEDTLFLQYVAPETWRYLLSHEAMFAQRKSSIYKNAPRFSIFGVGEYTFAPWKIAISGLYKNIKFSLISSYHNKPIVLDDTCYMLGFGSYQQAVLVYELLISEMVGQFIDSIIFLDNKRPVTSSLLNRIRLLEVAKVLGKEETFFKLFNNL